MPLDMSALTSPPKKRASAPRAPRKAVQTQPEPQVSSSVTRREVGLNGLAQLGQGLLMAFGQHADAATIGMHFPPISHELAKVADANEKVAKPIDFLIEAGPYGALISAVLPLAFQLAANHGLIDAAKMPGQVLPPEVLDARMKTQMLQAAADAKRQQNEALAEARKAQSEFEAAMREAENG